jgi:hypothetical protein
MWVKLRVEEEEARITPLMETPLGTEEPPVQDGDGVTAVTPDTSQAQTQTATNGHTNGHHNGSAPSMIVPCTVCKGIYRWDDHGIMRCVRCWPPNTR